VSDANEAMRAVYHGGTGIERKSRQKIVSANVESFSDFYI
jgi:hypothetical protein